MTNIVDSVWNETNKISEIAYYLQDLSGSFYMTGNEVIGDKLMNISKELMQSSKNITTSVAKDITGQSKAAEESALATISACLAMSELQD